MNSRPTYTIQEIQGGINTGKNNGGNAFNPRQQQNATLERGNYATQSFQNNRNSVNDQNKGGLFDHKKTLIGHEKAGLEHRLLMSNPDDLLDETRSVKSEFDYSTKKKFVEMISGQNSKKFRLPGDSGNQREDDKASLLSKRSGLSMRSGRVGLTSKILDGINKGNNNVEPILEQPNEGDFNELAL